MPKVIFVPSFNKVLLVRENCIYLLTHVNSTVLCQILIQPKVLVAFKIINIINALNDFFSYCANSQVLLTAATVSHVKFHGYSFPPLPLPLITYDLHLAISSHFLASGSHHSNLFLWIGCYFRICST